METRILVLVSGVDIWKVTPSKSETVWSILTGGALHELEMARVLSVLYLPREPFCQN
jgi:hypothetical protein